MSRPVLGPIQSPIQWVTEALSLGVKRLGREADHSPPSSAEVNNAWSYTSITQYVFVAWRLVKQRDILSLLLVRKEEAVFMASDMLQNCGVPHSFLQRRLHCGLGH
jgi:hypothetical protein